MNDQFFLGQKLERAIPFHIDGVSEISVICWKHGNNDAVFMVVGCFIDSIANRKLRHRAPPLESSTAIISLIEQTRILINEPSTGSRCDLKATLLIPAKGASRLPFLNHKDSASDRSGSGNGSDASFLFRLSFGRRAWLVGARWSCGMSRRGVQVEDNLLSAFALTIGGALGVGLPMALVIIWVCS
jgi:hypothetical protein